MPFRQMIHIKVYINRKHEDEWKYPKDVHKLHPNKQLETVGDEHENPSYRRHRMGASEEDMNGDLRP